MSSLRLPLLVLLLLLVGTLGAQSVRVKLRNGNHLRGQLVPQGDCEGLRLALYPGDTLCIPLAQVGWHQHRQRSPDSVVPVAVADSLPPLEHNRKFQRLLNRSQGWTPPAPPRPGWYGRASASLSPVRQESRRWRNRLLQGSLWLDVGYRPTDQLAIGLSVGYDDLPNDQVPVYADVQYRLRNDRPNSPYVQARLGYGFLADKFWYEIEEPDDYRGGWTGYPSVGYQWATYRNSHWFVDVGYKLNRYRRVREAGDFRSETTVRYERYTLRLGFEF